MLGGDYQGELTSDVAPKPSKFATFQASLNKPFEQINQIQDYIFPGLSSENTRRQTQDRISAIDETLSDPRQGYGQQALNAVGSIVGGIVATLPATILASSGAGVVAGAVGFGAREIALELGTEGALSGYLATQVPLKALAKSPLAHYLPGFSIAAAAEKTLEAYAVDKVFTLPEHFSQHYDAINNSLDSSHMLEDWGSDNYGFLMGGAGLAAGYIAFKGVRGVIAHRAANAESKAIDAELKRLLQGHEEVLKASQIKEGEAAQRQARVSELQDHLEQAEEMGFISPEMHEWYLDYLENPNHIDTHRKGFKILQQLQIPYDRVTGRVWNEVLSREGVNTLRSALFDQSLTNFSEEESQLLSSYIIHNQLDGYIGAMRENPNLLMAMQGMTHDLTGKIEAHSLALKEFDTALTRHLPKGLMKRELFSQKNIYEHLKKIGITNTRDVPYHVPKSIQDKLKIVKKIKLIESRNSAKYERLFKSGRHIELKEQLKEDNLLLPKEELNYLKDKLLPDGKLIHNYKNKDAFHRLEDLSQVWPNAKVLLDRINMESINAKQKGLNEILKKFTEMVDIGASVLAHPDNVKRYLHTRIERAVPFVREFEQSGIKLESTIEEVEKVIHKPEIMFDESSVKVVDTSDLDFAKESFKLSERKFKQFSENEAALNELITCWMGE